MRRTLLLLTTLLLAGCVDDSASYYIDGSDHALTVRAEQQYFWNDAVTLKLVASRWPECQRQFPLTTVPASQLAVGLYASGENTWTVRVGQHAWQIETRTCTQLGQPALSALGEPVGKFWIKDEKMVFEPASAPAPKP